MDLPRLGHRESTTAACFAIRQGILDRTRSGPAPHRFQYDRASEVLLSGPGLDYSISRLIDGVAGSEASAKARKRGRAMLVLLRAIRFATDPATHSLFENGATALPADYSIGRLIVIIKGLTEP